jgi:hypothetical protein
MVRARDATEWSFGGPYRKERSDALATRPSERALRRLVYAIARRQAGELPDVVAAMAHHRKLL